MNHDKKHSITLFFVFSLLFYLVFNHGWLGVQTAKQFDSFSDQYVVADLTYAALYPGENSPLPMYYGTLSGEKGAEYFSRYYDRTLIARESFQAYPSPVGVHFKLYRAVAKALDDPQRTIAVLYAANAWLMSFVFAAFVVWVHGSFGLFTAILMGVFLLFFPAGLIAYGRNLYWAAWTLFFPFVALLFVEKALGRRHAKLAVLFLVSTLAFLPRFLCSQEFTSSLILCAALPPFVCACPPQPAAAGRWKRSAVYCLGALSAFLAGCVVRWVQLAAAAGSPAFAKELYFAQMSLHTKGIPEDILWQNKEWVSVFPADIVSMYLNQTAFTVLGLPVRYLDVFLLALLPLLSAVFLVPACKRDAHFRAARSLSVVALLSLACPVSWFILATFHSYFHPHLNYILWYIPCILLCVLSLLQWLKWFYAVRREAAHSSPLSELQSIVYATPIPDILRQDLTKEGESDGEPRRML